MSHEWSRNFTGPLLSMRTSVHSRITMFEEPSITQWIVDKCRLMICHNALVFCKVSQIKREQQVCVREKTRIWYLKKCNWENLDTVFPFFFSENKKLQMITRAWKTVKKNSIKLELINIIFLILYLSTYIHSYLHRSILNIYKHSCYIVHLN